MSCCRLAFLSHQVMNQQMAQGYLKLMPRTFGHQWELALLITLSAQWLMNNLLSQTSNQYVFHCLYILIYLQRALHTFRFKNHFLGIRQFLCRKIYVSNLLKVSVLACKKSFSQTRYEDWVGKVAHEHTAICRIKQLEFLLLDPECSSSLQG